MWNTGQVSPLMPCQMSDSLVHWLNIINVPSLPFWQMIYRYCTNIVKRNYLLATLRSKRVNLLSTGKIINIIITYYYISGPPSPTSLNKDTKQDVNVEILPPWSWRWIKHNCLTQTCQGYYKTDTSAVFSWWAEHQFQWSQGLHWAALPFSCCNE